MFEYNLQKRYASGIKHVLRNKPFRKKYIAVTKLYKAFLVLLSEFDFIDLQTKIVWSEQNGSKT